MAKVRKIVNDPVYGFITIPDDLAFAVIEHPWFQRLRRISQLGLTSMVYPGALHTRFHHALGAMHLMGLALETLKSKGFPVSDEDTSGAMLAILLHDIGHGPFSHALENCIVQDFTHEEISEQFLNRLNLQFDNKLDTAIRIFNNTHPVKFLHQLVSGQLDMDRMDYLMRDSFYTGVSEGVINTERLLKMLTLAGDELGIESKGIYSIEKFIVARRLMYWQVYYHKTVLSAEYMLVNILKRAKKISMEGENLFATPAFSYFLTSAHNRESFINNPETLEAFARLDDADIMASIKVWTEHPDKVLSYLCKSLINRELFRVIISPEPFSPDLAERVKNICTEKLGISAEDSEYLYTAGTISNNAYDPGSHRINIINKDGSIKDIADISDQLNIAIYSGIVEKHFVCYPKWAEQFLK
ncbi:MAG: HD domain-containing protein [Bacteroidales bacterium]|nr:HD domain-containing protein [Bacteroidales bacterium]